MEHFDDNARFIIAQMVPNIVRILMVIKRQTMV